MNFEKLGSQVIDISNQLYQQKFVGRMGAMLAGGKSKLGSTLGQAFSTSYMAATSGMDSYDLFKEAGATDWWAGLGTVGVMLGFYTFLNNNYYKDVLFGEDSMLNENFVMNNTMKNLGAEIRNGLAGTAGKPTKIEAEGFVKTVATKVKGWATDATKAIKGGLEKEALGEKLAETAVETETAAAKKITASGVEKAALDAARKTATKNGGAFWYGGNDGRGYAGCCKRPYSCCRNSWITYNRRQC